MSTIPNFSEKMKMVFKADPLKPIFQDFINQGTTLDDLLETIGELSEEDYKDMFLVNPIPREHFIQLLSHKFTEVQEGK